MVCECVLWQHSMLYTWYHRSIWLKPNWTASDSHCPDPGFSNAHRKRTQTMRDSSVVKITGGYLSVVRSDSIIVWVIWVTSITRRRPGRWARRRTQTFALTGTWVLHQMMRHRSEIVQVIERIVSADLESKKIGARWVEIWMNDDICTRGANRTARERGAWHREIQSSKRHNNFDRISIEIQCAIVYRCQKNLLMWVWPGI